MTTAEARSNSWTRDRIGAMTKNVELLAFHDLGGRNHAGYQMSMQEVNGRFYLYCAHWAVNGISILDVTDPSRPELLRFVPEQSGKKGISMVKLQIAGGIGITHMQQRKFDMFFGPQPKGTEYDEGLILWDFRNPEHPKPVSRWNTGTPWGTHRNFYNGGRYAHLTAGAPGYKGFIYRIMDIPDPANPKIVGQWAHPEQPADSSDQRHVELHMPYIVGSRAYLASLLSKLAGTVLVGWRNLRCFHAVAIVCRLRLAFVLSKLVDAKSSICCAASVSMGGGWKGSSIQSQRSR